MIFHIGENWEHIDLKGQLVPKEPLWYRKDYDRPAPIPVTVHDLGFGSLAIDEFWPHKPDEEVLYVPADLDEALMLHKATYHGAHENSAYGVLWSPKELCTEMMNNPLSKEDVDSAIASGLRVQFDAADQYSLVAAQVDMGKRMITFNMNKFYNKMSFKGRERGRHVAHELFHYVFRAGVVDLRAPGGPTTLASYPALEEILQEEEKFIVSKRPEVIRYAVERFHLVAKSTKYKGRTQLALTEAH